MLVAQILSSVVLAALVAGIVKLISDGRKRAHADLVGKRTRLGPKFRELIGICQDMQGVASRLENDPARELAVESDAIQRFRKRMDAVVEPDLANGFKQLDDALTAMTQWWGMAAQVQGMLVQGQHANPRVRDRIDQLAESTGAALKRIKGELEAQLKKLEG